MLSTAKKLQSKLPAGGKWYGVYDRVPMAYPDTAEGFVIAWDLIKDPEIATKQRDATMAAAEAARLAVAAADAAAAAAADDPTAEKIDAASKAAAAAEEAKLMVEKKKKEEKKELGKKAYGIYPTAEEMHRNILQNDVGDRCGYEVIQEDMPCAGYIDAEWYGERDDHTHNRIRKCLAALRVYCRQDGREPEIYVCCGSRQEGDHFKNSYHIIVANFVFRASNSNVLKKFSKNIAQTSKWWIAPVVPTPTAEGILKEKTIIDDAVYTKNRLMRLPLNCKRGSTVPLIRISGDPTDEDEN